MNNTVLIRTSPFGTWGERSIRRYELEAPGGLRLSLLDLGCRIQHLFVPSGGSSVDVVLGYDDLAAYIHDRALFGAAVGPVADRISGAGFALSGKQYALEPNAAPDCIHSGSVGYQGTVWNAMPIDSGICFHQTFPEGAFGFAGPHSAQIRYTLPMPMTLQIEYILDGSVPSVFNPTNHSYFNLNGSDHITDHRLQIAAPSFAEIREGVSPVPTGRLLSVSGTPLDFTTPKAPDRFLTELHPQTVLAGGLDHYFPVPGRGMRTMAKLIGEKSRICMECCSDAPGILVYTANSLDHVHGKDGRCYQPQSAVCLETEAIPDAVHLENYKSLVCRSAHEPFRTVTSFVFSSAGE